MRKKTIAIALAAAAALSMSAAVHAEDNGELVLFTWELMFPQEVLDGFTERTGIDVIYSNFDTDETMLEKLAQANGGDYDVIVADDYIIEQAIQEGLVSEIDRDVWRGGYEGRRHRRPRQHHL